MTSQVDREIKIETSNIYSVNKVLLQQILETVGQITGKTLNKNPQRMWWCMARPDLEAICP